MSDADAERRAQQCTALRARILDMVDAEIAAGTCEPVSAWCALAQALGWHIGAHAKPGLLNRTILQSIRIVRDAARIWRAYEAKCQ